MSSPLSSPPAPGEPRVSETGTGASEPGETLGRYRLLKKIARGGMAEVFAARSFGAHGFEKTVAIKRILPRYGNDPQFVRMMVDEAKITVLLNHPNVATIFELCEQDGDYFIVMEFVPGQSLASLGKRLREKEERLGILEACFIVVELLQGLHAAHVQKEASGKPAHIIHRDVSPQNVLVSFDGHVKVIDFGIARAMHRLEATEVGTIKGKLRYLAPEMIDPGRFMKSGDFDHRVDVFAAGIVLWELLAARTLYQGDDEMVVYDAITDTDAPDLERMGMCDAALARIVKKALTRDPEVRYLTAEDFADELRAYVYRTDPAFTHKRIAAVLERFFPVEKQHMLALERGAVLPLAPGRTAAPSLPGEVRAGLDPAHLHSPIEAMPEPAKPAPEPRMADPDDATRTQAVSSEGGQGGRGRDVRSDARRPGSTRHMRAGESSKRSSPVSPPAAVGHAGASSGPKKAIIPVDEDERGPAQGDVLTVMTLVSRSGAAVAGRSVESAAVFTSGAPSRTERAAQFLVGGETLTVNDEARGSAAPQSRAPPDAPRSAPDLRRVVDETPHTRDRARTLEPPPPTPGKKRLVAAAALGIAIAVAIVAAYELLTPPRSELPAPGTPIHVVVTSKAAGATATALGAEVAIPATFSALPGDSLEVLVRAPGYKDESVRVSIPREGATDRTLDVVLSAAPVSLVLEVAPPDATVLVDEAPYVPGMLVAPGKPTMLHVSAPGFVPFKREIEVRPGLKHRERVELKPDGVAAPTLADTNAEAKKRDRDERARAASTRPGTLILRTKDMWGQVTIDGKTWEETTPLTVELKPGRHSVVVAHPPKGFKKSFVVTLKPGETVMRSIAFE